MIVFGDLFMSSLMGKGKQGRSLPHHFGINGRVAQHFDGSRQLLKEILLLQVQVL